MTRGGLRRYFIVYPSSRHNTVTLYSIDFTIDFTIPNYRIQIYATIHSRTLEYTTLPFTTSSYTTLPYTTLHYTTLHYTTLHYTTLYYTTLSPWIWPIWESGWNFADFGQFMLLMASTMVCCTTLCCTLLHYVVWHTAALCYTSVVCQGLDIGFACCSMLGRPCKHVLPGYARTGERWK